jgi:lantibiotic modifying enzyme
MKIRRPAIGLAWQDLPAQEKCDLYYGNAGVILFLQELYRATGRKEYAEAIQRGLGFLDQNLPEIKLYGMYDSSSW